MGTTPGLAGEILAVYAFWHRRYDIFGDSLWRILSGTVGSQSDAFFTAGYAVGFVCNYFLTTFFTFRSKPSSRNAVGFGFSHLLNYLLEVGLLNLFLWIGFGEFLAPILVLIVVVPINFLILHFVYTYKNKQ